CIADISFHGRIKSRCLRDDSRFNLGQLTPNDLHHSGQRSIWDCGRERRGNGSFHNGSIEGRRGFCQSNRLLRRAIYRRRRNQATVAYFSSAICSARWTCAVVIVMSLQLADSCAVKCFLKFGPRSTFWMLPCCNSPRRVRRCAAPATFCPFHKTSARAAFAKQDSEIFGAATSAS